MCELYYFRSGTPRHDQDVGGCGQGYARTGTQCYYMTRPHNCQWLYLRDEFQYEKEPDAEKDRLQGLNVNAEIIGQFINYCATSYSASATEMLVGWSILPNGNSFVPIQRTLI